jgi:hypothetical protein
MAAGVATAMSERLPSLLIIMAVYDPSPSLSFELSLSAYVDALLHPETVSAYASPGGHTFNWNSLQNCLLGARSASPGHRKAYLTRAQSFWKFTTVPDALIAKVLALYSLISVNFRRYLGQDLAFNSVLREISDKGLAEETPAKFHSCNWYGITGEYLNISRHKEMLAP